MEIKDIEKLAKLARIEITENEKQAFAKDLESILGYVDQIREVVVPEAVAEVGETYNVLRKDEQTNQGGQYTDKILANAPDTENGFLKVKKVL